MKRLRALIRSLLGLASDSPVADTPAAVGAGQRRAGKSEVRARTVISHGFKVELDLSSQVLALGVPVESDSDFSPDTEPRSVEAPLCATLGRAGSTAFVSASVLAQKAKIFDDGLYAAVEVAAQEGAGRHAGKAALLASLGRALAGADPTVAGNAPGLVLGAGRLGEVPVTDVPHGMEARVQQALEAFLADEARSKPVGFYTWSQQLGNIFRQDRMLQGEIDVAGIRAIASALRADPSARATYEHHLRLLSRLTNPFAYPDLRGVLEAIDRGDAGAAGEDVRFFPPSIGHETELVKKLYGNTPIPGEFVLADEMIRRIRSGELDLTPRPGSGWYDYQTWAMESLVIPERTAEGQRLRLGAGYRNLLIDLFKGLLTLNRETHVKQLKVPGVGASAAMPETQVVIDIAPALSAEPLATFYLRRALGYRYIRGVLEDAFGSQELETLHRLSPAGPVAMGLGEELSGMEALLLGAHVSVSRELGLPPDAAAGSDASATGAADRFVAWAGDLKSDMDLGADLRAMVPLFYDYERRKLKVWAFLGWARRPVIVSFARLPKATVYDSRGIQLQERPRIRWGSLHQDLEYPVTAELYVDELLDREEFRRLCDSAGTRSEILRRLG